MSVELGRLTPVLPRDVWPHEAHDFTPWLLQNVDVLSDLLKMDLVLGAAEHAVGSFSLDLIGHDESTGERVIVENQLEVSDHTHLGQIITYAAGTDPTTIVWITTGFRPEHRAAIDWVNEHTDENTRMFGVVIRLVQIGDSAVAPNFELVAQPNDWEKAVRTTSAASEPSAQALLYSEYWEQLLSSLRAEGFAWVPRGVTTKSGWCATRTGVASSSVVMWFLKRGLSLQLYFESSDADLNTARYEALEQHRDTFDRLIPGEILWDPMVGKKATRIVIPSPFIDVATREAWPAMNTWLRESQVALRAAMDAIGFESLMTEVGVRHAG